jgi:SAM-dependent methyltransferase
MTDGNRLEGALARTARRYVACGRFTRHYVASKLKRDPVHLELLRRAGADGYGTVADLGCGRGQVGVLLLEAGVASAVTGLDRVGPSLADARLAAAGLPYTACAQDLAQAPSPTACDTVLLIDVLYQLGPGPAVRLLAAAARAARRRVLVRTLDPDLGWRSRLAVTLERLGRLGWPHSGRHVAPVSVATLCAVLRQGGFEPDVSPSFEGTPFANVLVDATRR